MTIYRSCLSSVLLSLTACTTFKVVIYERYPCDLGCPAVPIWAVDEIANSLACLPKILDLTFDIVSRLPPKSLIQAGSCPNLQKFAIYFPAEECVISEQDFRVIREMIDVAISGKPNLKILDIGGDIITPLNKFGQESLGPIFSGPLLRKSPPLQLETLKAETEHCYEEWIMQARSHLTRLKKLHLGYPGSITERRAPINVVWDFLTTNNIHLRTLVLPNVAIPKTANDLSPLEKYLCSYSGLEELTIWSCSWDILTGWIQPMALILRAHSQSLKRLEFQCSLPEDDYSFLLEARWLQELRIAVNCEAELGFILRKVKTIPTMRSVWYNHNDEGMVTDFPMHVYINGDA